ncbi:hypothetical protein BKA67DRAFT_285681 [Truncatella angustata]|uniref:Zn(2)-C6 fungal-type domain-containing protein n=1 Tax=Truncatella angustata TaxID=152316 RepID=A0A9P8ULY7_9PEZI|nr:uncharacterized protein BKA67DRAFT_285681 [Truncatella angustata]KAH6654629.1 hypothetical protein BKA67DRAFT_285681 [Truncatella angustata]
MTSGEFADLSAHTSPRRPIGVVVTWARATIGCTVCKKKHIRCDEKTPLCTYCLRHGGECIYLDVEFGIPTNGRDKDSEVFHHVDDRSSPVSLGLSDSTPRNPFVGTGCDIPFKSRPLFQLFLSTRILHSVPIAREKDSFVVYRALSNPGFLHAALLMTTLQWAWSTGDSEQFRVPYLYHKLQAIRFVNEQLAESETAVDDGTIAAITSLALVENCLGSADAVAFHLRGLIRIKDLQRKVAGKRPMGLLQRLILMAARCIKSRPPYDILDILQTDDTHQSMIISLLGIAIRPIRPNHDIFALSRLDLPFETLSDCSHDSQALDNTSIGPLQSVDTSRSDFISCYFYLYIILRDQWIDSFVLNWFLEQLLADVCRTESLMQKGQYSQTLWFWTVMFGASATVAAKTTSSLEENQMKATKDSYMDKINLASQLLKIKSWEGAKSTMQLFAWEDGFDGEEELKTLWEEAVWADGSRRPKLPLV